MYSISACYGLHTVYSCTAKAVLYIIAPLHEQFLCQTAH